MGRFKEFVQSEREHLDKLVNCTFEVCGYAEYGHRLFRVFHDKGLDVLLLPIPTTEI